MARVYRNCAEIVAELPGVRDAVHHVAEVGAAKAEARLAAHRHTGAAKVELEFTDKDSIVSLVDEAAESIEFGGWNVWAKKYLPGLYIITGAFDIVKGSWRRGRS